MTKTRIVGMRGVALEVLLVTVGVDIFESYWGGIELGIYKASMW